MINNSVFFKDNILREYRNKIGIDKNLSIMNLTGIYLNIIEPYNTMIANSQLLGTRSKRRKLFGGVTETKQNANTKTQKNKKQVTKHVTKQVTKHVTKQVTKQVTKKTTKHVTKKATKPVTERRGKTLQTYVDAYGPDYFNTIHPSSSASLSSSSSSSPQSQYSITSVMTPINYTKQAKQATPSPKTRISTLQNKIQANLLSMIERLIEHTCKDEIAEDYGMSSIENSLRNNNFDIAIICERSVINTTSVEERLKLIYGIIIVERGECNLYPDAYTVNLICTNAGNMSKYLLGLYLYAIKKNEKSGVTQYGILELAGKYSNISGFCAYQKFGFQPNSSLVGDICFDDIALNNLPMMVDVTQFTITDIIDIVENRKILPKDKVCSITNKILQSEVASFKTLLYELKHTLNYKNVFIKRKNRMILVCNEFKKDISEIKSREMAMYLVTAYINRLQQQTKK
jgi:hypothetical protein